MSAKRSLGTGGGGGNAHMLLILVSVLVIGYGRRHCPSFADCLLSSTIAYALMMSAYDSKGEKREET